MLGSHGRTDVVALSPPAVNLLQIDIGEEEPVLEIPVDVFLDTIMSTWIREQNEGYKQLDETFVKYDENHDGVLSLEEFTSVLNTSPGMLP